MSQSKSTQLLGLLLGLALLGNAQAGDNRPPPPDLSQVLSLSADQSAQVHAILQAEHTQMHALHEQTRAQLAKVLTAAQLQTFESLPPPPPPGHHDGGDAPPPPN